MSVLVIDIDLSRNTWKLGIIKCIYPGKGGQVRTVVKVANVSPHDKKKKVKLFIHKRSVVKICPLSFGD